MADLVPRDFFAVDPFEIFKEFDDFFENLDKFVQQQFAGDIIETDALASAKIAEDNEKYTLSLVVPEGLKDKVNVRIDKTKVEITAQNNSSTKNQTFEQQAWKRIYHCYSIPANTCGERAKVNYSKGLLTIDIPKKG